jgi:hypothetical protein
MLRDTAVSIIAQRLGQRTDLTAAIIVEMQLQQDTALERNGKFTPWFLLSEWSSANTVANEERVPLPTDFLMEADEYPFQIYLDPTWTNLVKTGYDYARKTYPEPGQSKLYAMGDGYFYLFPNPDQIYPIRMKYYKKGLDITASNIENAWLKYAPDLVIAQTGEVMARQYTQNMQLAETFKAQAIEAFNSLYSQHVAREEVNRERKMVV